MCTRTLPDDDAAWQAKSPALPTPEERRVLQACARPSRAAPRPPPLTTAEQGERVRAYALTRSPSGEEIRGGEEELRALLRAPDIALACAAVLGLPTDRVGQGFRCILPGHAEAHPSASLYRDRETGALVYRDWHARDGVAWYTLPDVRASLAFNRAVRLRGPSVATWQLRLLVEMGILDPYPVTVGPLPPGVRPAVRKVYEGFAFLLACKWRYTPRAPAPFSWHFAAAWCELGERHAGEAIRWLLARGFLRQVGKHGWTALFLPGAVSVHQRIGVAYQRIGIAR